MDSKPAGDGVIEQVKSHVVDRKFAHHAGPGRHGSRTSKGLRA
jgi:hypothetical protein